MAANPSMLSFSNVDWSFLLDAPAVCEREFDTAVLRLITEDLATVLGGTYALARYRLEAPPYWAVTGPGQAFVGLTGYAFIGA
jgi:hypothetical protein